MGRAPRGARPTVGGVTTQTTRIVLAARPHGEPTDDDFRTETVETPEPGEGQLLLRTLYLSLDPYMRGRMSDAESYADPTPIDGVMPGGTVGEVVTSRAEGFSPGDVVVAYGGWQTHAVVPAKHVRRVDPGVAPVSTALGVLGMPGFTAYAGMAAIGRPQAGETVVVAAAAGPVGSAVGQIAQQRGARAVGIAGGPEKLEMLRELGFDAVVDHRSETFAEDLAAAVPDGVDVYFENVGGRVTREVWRHLNLYARIPVCGLVSGYNATSLPEGPDRVPALMSSILTKSLTLRGFIQTEFVPTHHDDFLREMGAWVADGTVRYHEDVVEGLENAPRAFVGMLRGENRGKLVVKVAD